MKFWDSSAIVPLLVSESSTALVRAEYRADPVICAWWGTLVECTSAVERAGRDGAAPPAAVEEARRSLDGLAVRWQEVEPGREVRETAVRLLREHDLRAADALQLAAAIVVAEGRPEALGFVSLDRRLVVAAAREGFPVSPS